MKHRSIIIGTFWVLLFLSSLFIFSCKKNKEIDLQPDVSAANGYVAIEDEMKYVFDMLVKAQKDDLLWSSGHSHIDSAWVTAEISQHKLFFDYNSICPDSIVRNGRIEATLSGPLFLKGTIISVIFLEYHVDVNKYEGTDTIKNLGVNTSGQWIFSASMNNGKIIQYIITGSINYQVQNQFLVDSVSVLSGNDFSYLIKGSVSGICSTGNAFEGLIRDSLTSRLSCHWIDSGVTKIKVTAANYTEGTIDFIKDDGCSEKMIYNFGNNIFYVLKLKRYLP